MDNEEKIKEYEAHKTPVPSYEEWQAKNVTLTTLLAEYGKLTKELQDEKEKHMTRPSLRSPADEVVIEKQVWESTLNRSMVLEAENAKLKKLLKLNNVLNKGSKSIYAWLKEDTTGEQKKLCADLFDRTVEMMSEIAQVLGEE